MYYTDLNPDNHREVVPADDLYSEGMVTLLSTTTANPLAIAYLGIHSTEQVETRPPDCNIQLVHFRNPDGTTDGARDFLASNGWKIQEHSYSLNGLSPRSTVLVIDEMFTPTLSDLSDEMFLALREILDRECRLLWVTMG